jgi:hypothetical protein
MLEGRRKKSGTPAKLATLKYEVFCQRAGALIARKVSHLPRVKRKRARHAARFHRVISQIGIAASFCLNPDLLRATGVGLHMDLFASVCGYDLERGGRIIQSHRLDLSLGREGVSDG